VLADLDSYFLAWVQRQTGERFTQEQLTDFDYVKSLGICKRLEGRFWSGVAFEMHASRLAPFDGAREFVAELQSRHAVRALTATSNAAWTGQRAEWLERCVGITPRHQIICGKAEKPYVQGDVLVEDAPHNADAWLAAQPGRVVLMSRPCNRTYDGGPRCLKADTYAQAVALIETPAKDAP
jgi:5'(3')-deoxyribonucleotidase